MEEIEIILEDESQEEILNFSTSENEEIVNLEEEYSSGVSDYGALLNKPQINGIPLSGDITTEDLGIIDDVNAYIEEHKEELRGQDGKDGYTPIKGVDYFDGKDGVNGKDGYTPVKGVDYFDGKNGTDGKDGYTPIKNVDYFDGVNGQDGYTPIKGTDYYTETDKQEMVNSVIEALPNGEEVSY